MKKLYALIVSSLALGFVGCAVDGVDNVVAPIGDNYWLNSNDGEYVYNSMDFTSGTINITKAGDVYTVSVNAKDDFGRNFEFTYTGAMPIVDKSQAATSTASKSHMAKKTFRKYSSAAKMQMPQGFVRK